MEIRFVAKIVPVEVVEVVEMEAALVLLLIQTEL